MIGELTATQCNTLQHIATHKDIPHGGTRRAHCNTLQHTATHCNTLQHTRRIARWDSDTLLQHTATHCQTQDVPHVGTWRADCNTLQHTATHCNALQHTATHKTYRTLALGELSSNSCSLSMSMNKSRHNMDQSRHTNAWVMAHMSHVQVWMSHVTHLNESCHTYESFTCVPWRICITWHLYVTRLTHICDLTTSTCSKWVVSHVCVTFGELNVTHTWNTTQSTFE